MPDSETVRAVFYCSACGQEAATIELTTLGQMVQAGFLSHWTETIATDKIPALRQALQAGKARAVHDIDRLWAPFYCPECEQVYCYNHWQVSVVFDSDFAGWYDCTYGICPQGHRRMIDD